ncbi:hypothetical protein [Lacipirellula sp.]|uniref:hypothetical protein n=1 Tax=Lacipirellula sp. TaxID=2691419 RepID=UPI003D123D27
MMIRSLQWMAWSALLIGFAGCDSAPSSSASSPGQSAPQQEAAATAPSPAEPAPAQVSPAPRDDREVQPASAVAPPATTPVAAAAPAAPVKLPDPDSSGYIEATFDDLKFDMTKTELFDRTMLTPKVNALMGKKIRIRGYIFPTLRKTGLNRIVLVRDNMECCFGPGAALFDCVLVTMAPGKTAEYTIRPVAVEGEIRLEELAGGPDGRPLAIYQMVGHEVE